MLEHNFICPYCWERISMLVDTSQPQQRYIEDCEVCCHPIDIFVVTEEHDIIQFQADSIEQ